MTTITYLEMRDPDALILRETRDPRFVVRECVENQWEESRRFYQAVGGAWQWTDRLDWSEAQWRAYAEVDSLRTFVAEHGGQAAGYFELSRDKTASVQITYFGLLPAFIGHGLGGPLLSCALRNAWSWDARRVWLHTCTKDHPAALENYLKSGFVIYDRKTQA